MKQAILIVDDHPAWSDCLRSRLRQDPQLFVQGRVGSKSKALTSIEAETPNIMVIDVKLRDGNGLDLCQRVLKAQFSIACVILTAYDEDAYLARARDSGAVGYLLKEETVATLEEAIRQVAQGETLWTEYQILRIHHWQEKAGNKWALLTQREQEVVASLVNFRSDSQIAEKLNISVGTVHRHIHHLLGKLGMTNRREVARWAIWYKLVDR